MVEKNIIQRLPHECVLYKQDNGTISGKLTIELVHSTYMTVLDRLMNNRNGRGALLALKETLAYQSVWENTIKEYANFLENRKWTGTTDITLERHASGNQEGYTFISEAVDHVYHHIPTEHTCCTNFIE